ncbi:hypothetical protein [Lactococcus formosensis]|jgi:hypothetical protein|uniref:Uncharacterized protein n=1 Tax=Lactococcus formosensis TaxID=1281486 RepID=A0A9Q9D7Q2_9LACT|nr:hypothetical protein [Lactococcus formosensis]USJ21445.1 hypothetical protein LMK00_05455 [Lactococcus formosensis]
MKKTITLAALALITLVASSVVVNADSKSQTEWESATKIEFEAPDAESEFYHQL